MSRHHTPNIITQTDSYKAGAHWNMYPEGTEYVYSYFEARTGSRFSTMGLFGLQPILMDSLEGVVVTRDKIEAAAKLFKAHFGTDSAFNRKGWEHILNAHGGRLPIRIKAAPEGLPIPVSNVLFTVENTDPAVPWITNYVESLLSHVWYPSTVSALSRATKELIKSYLDKTADSSASLPFGLHDFAYRSVSSDESGGMGGMAHLVNFLGTDTPIAMEYAMEYYGASLDGLAYSVPASEHSIMTSRGRSGESEVLDDLLLKYPTGILSVVGDSYDIYHFVRELMGKRFKDRILKRDGVFVVRPDSTTPIHPTPAGEMVWINQQLASDFGYVTNGKGYMSINPKVRSLWGDGLEYETIDSIYSTLTANQFAADNVATLGEGSGLLQKVHRDMCRCAFKSSAQCRNGVWHDVYKEPKDLSKRSKRGKLALIRDADGQYQTVAAPHPDDLLQTVFESGAITKRWTFDEVRHNAALPA